MRNHDVNSTRWFYMSAKWRNRRVSAALLCRSSQIPTSKYKHDKYNFSFRSVHTMVVFAVLEIERLVDNFSFFKDSVFHALTKWSLTYGTSTDYLPRLQHCFTSQLVSQWSNFRCSTLSRFQLYSDRLKTGEINLTRLELTNSASMGYVSVSARGYKARYCTRARSFVCEDLMADTLYEGSGRQ